MKAKEITDDFIQDIYDQCNQDTITKSDFYLSGFKDGQSHASTPTRQVSDEEIERWHTFLAGKGETALEIACFITDISLSSTREGGMKEIKCNNCIDGIVKIISSGKTEHKCSECLGTGLITPLPDPPTKTR